MPKQEPSGQKGPTVRRAVPLSGSAGPPDPDLLPKKSAGPGETSGEPASGGPTAPPPPPASFEPAVSEPATAQHTSTRGPRPAPAPETDPETAPETDPQAGPEAGPEAVPGGGSGTNGAVTPAKSPRQEGASTSRTATTATTATTASTAAASAAGNASPGTGGRGAGSAGTAAAAASALPPESSTATATGGDEPPSGRPTKALRAAAAITGALLIAVPLLVLGSGDDDKKKPAQAAAAGMTVPKGDEAAAGSYQGKPPSPSPSTEDKDKDKDAKDKDQDAKGVEEVQAGPGDSGKGAGSESDSESDSGKDTQKDDKKNSAVSKPDSPAVPRLTSGVGSTFVANKQLRNAMTGLCADISGYGKGKPESRLMQYRCAESRSSDNQTWDIVRKQDGKAPNGSDLYVIRNSTDGLCMDLPGKGKVPGATGVQEYKCDGGLDDNQLWWLDGRGDGKWWLRNYTAGNMCLDVWGKGFGTGGSAARLGVANCYPADDHEWRLT